MQEVWSTGRIPTQSHTLLEPIPIRKQLATKTPKQYTTEVLSGEQLGTIIM